jgi:tagatose 1,6-diphosphate aldolase
MPSLSAGKLRRLLSLADRNGRFKMLAIDQRASLQNALGQALGIAPTDVCYEALATVKEVITSALAPHATAVLTDPLYGYARSIPVIPGDIGLLLAHEWSGYDPAGEGGRERLSRTIEGWSVESAARAGADALKFLVFYHPDASEATRRHQQDLVRSLGEACERLDLVFFLEVMTYALEGATDTPEHARVKGDLVNRSAAEFSKPEYRVDALKLEFPAELKYCREFAGGAFDGRERPPQYSLAGVREACAALDAVCAVPWVILSAGVEIAEFLVNVELAAEAGASGFLCGRALWKDSLPLYPDVDAMGAFLETTARVHFARANAAVELARPFWDHPCFGGHDHLAVACEGPRWAESYGGGAGEVPAPTDATGAIAGY